MHDPTAPAWRGVNHLALVTDDMDSTVRFYHGALGARLVATLGTATFRHYFFEIGDGSTVAFFEYRGVRHEPLRKAAGVPDPRAVQFDHVSLCLPDEASLLALRDRLRAHGCEVTEVVDHRMIRSIYFTDPNGIALEASWWVNDATTAGADYADPARFADPDPVAAVRELAEHGALQGPGPRTHLV
jgi:catechol 2,3-dioxygenase-like lactoylglutathione lyase family enzyme